MVRRFRYPLGTVFTSHGDEFCNFEAAREGKGDTSDGKCLHRLLLLKPLLAVGVHWEALMNLRSSFESISI